MHLLPTGARLRDLARSVLGRSRLRAIGRGAFLAYAERRGISASVESLRLRFAPGDEPVEREPDRSDWVHHADYVMTRAFLRAIRPGDVVADVGAYHGTYTVLAAAKAGPVGRVTAFEPTPQGRAALARNVAMNDFASRVTVSSAVVGDRAGVTTFYVTGDQSQNSLYRSAVAHAGSPPVATTLECVTLDGYFQTGARPAVVKIDAEGAEFAILRGGEETLAAGARVFCEMHPYAWAEAGHTESELTAWLDARGRSVVDLRTGRPPVGAIDYGPYELVISGAPASA